jgi:hypothetical protein
VGLATVSGFKIIKPVKRIQIQNLNSFKFRPI